MTSKGGKNASLDVEINLTAQCTVDVVTIVAVAAAAVAMVAAGVFV